MIVFCCLFYTVRLFCSVTQTNPAKTKANPSKAKVGEKVSVKLKFKD